MEASDQLHSSTVFIPSRDPGDTFDASLDEFQSRPVRGSVYMISVPCRESKPDPFVHT